MIRRIRASSASTASRGTAAAPGALAEGWLADRYVIAPDLLGHGSSPYEPPWSIDEHVRLLLEAVGDEPAAWIGHSFGGRLAFEVAGRRPELVERLVLLDPAILIDPEIALLVAEKDRRDRSYASFEEGIERRFVESLLTRTSRDARRRGSAGVPRRGRGRPLALPLQPGVGDRRLRRDGVAAAAVRGRPHPDPARARRGLLRHLRPPDRRRIARRSATCCRRSPFPAGTPCSGMRSTRPRPRSPRSCAPEHGLDL